MRPLALAAIAALLAGCSLNYADTTFKATPPFKHATEGEGGHEGGEKVAEHMSEVDKPSEIGLTPTAVLASPADPSALGQTPAVFPNDALPSGKAPDHVRPGGE